MVDAAGTIYSGGDKAGVYYVVCEYSLAGGGGANRDTGDSVAHLPGRARCEAGTLLRQLGGNGEQTSLETATEVQRENKYE